MAYAHNLAREINVFQSWIKDLEEKSLLSSPEDAYATVRAVLQTLRDRLTLEEGADLSSQLPLIARGIFYEGWKPSNTPRKISLDEFLDEVRHKLQGNCPNVDEALLASSVFELLEKHVSEGEMSDVRSVLPKEFRALFPELKTDR